jgi:hypothetical protein
MKTIWKRAFVVFALTLFVGSIAHAGAITTLFAADNSGDNGGAVYFNLTVGSNPLLITGLDTNTAEVGVFPDFRVYTKLGTVEGFETNAGAWALATTGILTGMGTDNPIG